MMVAAVSKKVYISWNTFPATSGSANLIRIGSVFPSVVMILKILLKNHIDK